MNATAILSVVRRLVYSGLGAPVLLMTMLCMMVLPLPPVALDLLFTFNISLSLVIMMAAIYSARPLDFGSFPTVLLIATLLRLALNVASTRIVLLDGHTGSGAAGRVIEAFGAFVVGGSYAVGLVVFAVLVIINFLVVTKGASRISEVSARFTLDALPGKQMAIDADLNAGLITQDEAKERRAEVAQDADFYGAMDGAGKFVRGDAVAGILILLINILGGLTIGTLQHGLPFSEAVRNYTLLTIGDGLVAQIPSLVLSSAAAIMVTRVSAAEDMGHQILSQLLGDPRYLAVTAGVMGLMGLVPGMPNLAFLGLAAAAGAATYFLHRRRVSDREPAPAEEPPPTAEVPELSWEDVSAVDPLELEVGYRLIPMVDTAQGGELMARIKGVRRKATQELGFLVPAVHIRDNLELAASGYRISVMGVPVGEAEVRPGQELAINPGEIYGELDGESTRDPVFGLEAVWIDPGVRDQAQAYGYTVVDANTVIATHLSQVLTDHSYLLLGHQETQQLLDRMATTHAKLVENLTPKALALGVVTRVLQNLLEEKIPIRDLRTIAESLAQQADKSQDPDALTAVARVALGRFIVQHIYGSRDELPVITLDPALDQILHQAFGVGEAADQALEPGLAQRIHQGLAEAIQAREAAGEPAVLLVSDAIRPALARFVRHANAAVHVLGFGEMPDNRNLRIVATLGGEPAGPGLAGVAA